MNEEKGIAAVERVATGLHETLAAEFESPLGDVGMSCVWAGEDFNKITLATPVGKLSVIVTSVVGERGADVRVVVFDSTAFECGDIPCPAHVRELGRVARAVAAIPGVDSVWRDPAWPKTFLASARLEGGES